MESGGLGNHRRHPPVAPPPTQPAETAGLRILAVEDNPVNQRLVVKVLGNLGHSVSVADNGQLALAALAKHTFDVILMDVQMPIMDGLTATREIRRLGIGLPIIAMTADNLPGDREKCLDAGMTAYLTKPLSREALAAALTRHVRAAAA